MVKIVLHFESMLLLFTLVHHNACVLVIEQQLQYSSESLNLYVHRAMGVQSMCAACRRIATQP